jgi:hypothetical protein
MSPFTRKQLWTCSLPICDRGATGPDAKQAGQSADGALALARRIGSPSELAAALWTASLTRVRDEPDEALAFAEESIELTRAGASGSVLGHLLPIRAQLRAANGDAAGAVRDLREAITYSEGTGDKVMLMVAFDRSISVFDALGLAEPAAVLAGVVLRGPGLCRHRPTTGEPCNGLLVHLSKTGEPGRRHTVSMWTVNFAAARRSASATAATTSAPTGG